MMHGKHSVTMDESKMKKDMNKIHGSALKSKKKKTKKRKK